MISFAHRSGRLIQEDRHLVIEGCKHVAAGLVNNMGAEILANDTVPWLSYKLQNGYWDYVCLIWITYWSPCRTASWWPGRSFSPLGGCRKLPLWSIKVNKAWVWELSLHAWRSLAWPAPCRKRGCLTLPFCMKLIKLLYFTIKITISQKQHPPWASYLGVSLYSKTLPAFCCCRLLFKSWLFCTV